jgi:hypothetical protein
MLGENNRLFSGDRFFSILYFFRSAGPEEKNVSEVLLSL